MLMKSGGSNANASKEEGAPGGRCGKQPHWRRREQETTTVYVVHPTQFRTVVQQLTGTGAASPPPLSSHHHGVGGGGGNGAGAGTRTNAVAQALALAQAQAEHGGGEQSGGSRGRTLGQMYQDCLAWANADDS